MNVYLCGPIEKEVDGGKGIRDKIKRAFKSHENINFIDPCEFEYNSEFKSVKEIKKNKPKIWKDIVKTMIKGDLDGVKNSDIVLTILNKNASVGSYSEMVFAAYNNVPVVIYLEDSTQSEKLHPWIQTAAWFISNEIEEIEKTIVAFCLAFMKKETDEVIKCQKNHQENPITIMKQKHQIKKNTLNLSTKNVL